MAEVVKPARLVGVERLLAAQAVEQDADAFRLLEPAASHVVVRGRQLGEVLALEPALQRQSVHFLLLQLRDWRQTAEEQQRAQDDPYQDEDGNHHHAQRHVEAPSVVRGHHLEDRQQLTGEPDEEQGCHGPSQIRQERPAHGAVIQRDLRRQVVPGGVRRTRDRHLLSRRHGGADVTVACAALVTHSFHLVSVCHVRHLR